MRYGQNTYRNRHKLNLIHRMQGSVHSPESRNVHCCIYSIHRNPHRLHIRNRHGVSVSHTVYSLCCSIFLCSLCHFYCTDTRNRIIYLKCICTGIVVRCSGICGQSTPACGDGSYCCCRLPDLHQVRLLHGWFPPYQVRSGTTFIMDGTSSLYVL